MPRLHQGCTADLHATPIKVYDWDCGDCQADYLRGQGLHESVIKLAIMDKAGPGAELLAAKGVA